MPTAEPTPRPATEAKAFLGDSAGNVAGTAAPALLPRSGPSRTGRGALPSGQCPFCASAVPSSGRLCPTCHQSPRWARILLYLFTSLPLATAAAGWFTAAERPWSGAATGLVLGAAASGFAILSSFPQYPTPGQRRVRALAPPAVPHLVGWAWLWVLFGAAVGLFAGAPILFAWGGLSWPSLRAAACDGTTWGGLIALTLGAAVYSAQSLPVAVRAARFPRAETSPLNRGG